MSLMLSAALLMPSSFQRLHAAEATPASAIKVVSGFKVNLLYSAATGDGSWISMTMDSKERLIISGQGSDSLLQVTITNGQVALIERKNWGVSGAMGLYYGENSLFVDGNGPSGWGIYRLQATNDSFGPAHLLRPMSDASEHGTHAIVVGPDHKVYAVFGDFTREPADLLPSSPFRHYADDQLLPRGPDGNGFNPGGRPPGGSVIRMDLDGKNCELFAGNSRNTYCIAFNADGELFGFDNDMNWDYGTPWYRPCRVNHWISGGDYGHRQGTGKFPNYYEDTLPATLDVGLGAPTGVAFGPTNGMFPAAYRDACFIEDWAYGRLIVVHLKPHGASYDASAETVLHGVPLNMTALQFGHDGSLYFVTGGHNTESGLYRLSYVGPKMEEVKQSRAQLAAAESALRSRALRHHLEELQTTKDSTRLKFIWNGLKSEDRWVRYAARIALENQDTALWERQALKERNVDGGLTALMALARCGGPKSQRELLVALNKFSFSRLNEEQERLKLRVMELSFIRQGHPDLDMVHRQIHELDRLYPAKSEYVNRELCQLLLYLDAPDTVAKTLQLLAKARTQEEQIYYVMRLRNIKSGWTMDRRKEYLNWFNKKRSELPHSPGIVQYFTDVGQGYADGGSVPGFLQNFRREAIGTLTANERETLSPWFAGIRDGSQWQTPAQPSLRPLPTTSLRVPRTRQPADANVFVRNTGFMHRSPAVAKLGRMAPFAYVRALGGRQAPSLFKANIMFRGPPFHSQSLREPRAEKTFVDGKSKFRPPLDHIDGTGGGQTERNWNMANLQPNLEPV